MGGGVIVGELGVCTGINAASTPSAAGCARCGCLPLLGPAECCDNQSQGYCRSCSLLCGSPVGEGWPVRPRDSQGPNPSFSSGPGGPDLIGRRPLHVCSPHSGCCTTAIASDTIGAHAPPPLTSRAALAVASTGLVNDWGKRNHQLPGYRAEVRREAFSNGDEVEPRRCAKTITEKPRVCLSSQVPRGDDGPRCPLVPRVQDVRPGTTLAPAQGTILGSPSCVPLLSSVVGTISPNDRQAWLEACHLNYTCGCERYDFRYGVGRRQSCSCFGCLSCADVQLTQPTEISGKRVRMLQTHLRIWLTSGVSTCMSTPTFGLLEGSEGNIRSPVNRRGNGTNLFEVRLCAVLQYCPRTLPLSPPTIANSDASSLTSQIRQVFSPHQGQRPAIGRPMLSRNADAMVWKLRSGLLDVNPDIHPDLPSLQDHTWLGGTKSIVRSRGHGSIPYSGQSLRDVPRRFALQRVQPADGGSPSMSGCVSRPSCYPGTGSIHNHVRPLPGTRSPQHPEKRMFHYRFPGPILAQEAS